MGRGRQKAKPTQVAGELKYQSPAMDLDSLQKELASQPPGRGWSQDSDDDYDYDSDYRGD